MPATIYSQFQLGDIVASYLTSNKELAPIELQLTPAAKNFEPTQRREYLDSDCVLALPEKWQPIQAWELSSLIQLKLAGEPAPGGFSNGRTSHGNAVSNSLRLKSQEKIQNPDKTCIRTTLQSHSGLTATHELSHHKGERSLRLQTTLKNTGSDIITIEALSSFSIGGISPYSKDDGPGRFQVHRMRSAWSAEGRASQQSIEDLHLERSWSGYSVQCERFGSVGSMPVKGWHPWLAVEDKLKGVSWAATLAHPGSWQMEIVRKSDQFTLSGGQADFEFGHWKKDLQPNDQFRGPEAFLTVTTEGIEKAANRLSDPIRSPHRQTPNGDETLPIVFNEWCTSWGKPNHQNIIELADRIKNTGIRYLVIDDGWAQRSPEATFQENGDWIICPKAFPEGLRKTADAIRERGLIPGIWFEFEVVNSGTNAWNQVDHLLKRDGKPLQVGTRRFWDFRDPWVHQYLTEKVTKLLKNNRIGYLKVDYNDTIGLGCDGAESLGEGLRQHLEGVQQFFRSLRDALPELIIENCSSGGHRFEPSMLMLTDITSITDAHETPDIPIISANSLKIAPPSKNLIWAVLRDSDSMKRLSYSLSATFLGRMCLSGTVDKLDKDQWALMVQAIDLYNEMAPIIKDATFNRFGNWGDSYQHPTGGQAVRATALIGTTILIIWHTFESPPTTLSTPLPEDKDWGIEREFCDRPSQAHIESNNIVIPTPQAWSGGVITLKAHN
ncbi:alpha-galactosidase [Puniceicoccaceae bacterium K14]|nr:alpha-galactosidase [Puniceicoccaceae bacterium K14]